MTGLYTHLPFCRKKCHYCNFIISVSDDAKKHEVFLSTLDKEAHFYHQRFTNKPFTTFYVGGGTPSFLSEDATQNFFDSMHRNFLFEGGAEVTFEANPADVTPAKAKLYWKLGINRISLGAQSFNNDTLTLVNRDHKAADIEKAFYILREAGFKNISLDLILSLPAENLDQMKFSLEKAVKLAPEHFSLYELVIEPGTVFGGRSGRGELLLPDENTQMEGLSFARDYLKSSGYEHYELLSYAKKGHQSRHNLLYWANEEYLGLGPGAFSYLDGRRYKYAKSVEEYLRKIEAGEWKASEEEQLTGERKEIESLLLALRLIKGAEIKRFAKLLEKMQSSIASLKDKGLLTESTSHLSLTPKGQFLAETVFTELSTV